MRIEIQSSISLVFLSIMNMCFCLQDFASKTINSISSSEIVHHARRHSGASHQSDFQHHSNKWNDGEPFLLIDYLADGELERRINFNGITAKETSIGDSRYVNIFVMFFFKLSSDIVCL